MSVDVGSMPPWKRELLERKRRQEDDERRRQGEEVERMASLPSWKRDLMLKKHKQKNTMVFLSKSTSSGDVVDSAAKDVPIENGSLAQKSEPRSPVNGDVTVSLVSVSSGPGKTENHLDNVTVAPSSPRQMGGDGTTAEFDTSYVTGGESVNGEGHEHLIPIQYNPWLKSDIVQKRGSRHSSSKLSDTSSPKSNTIMANDSIPQPGYHASDVSSRSSTMETPESHPPGTESTAENDNDSVFGEEEVTYGRGFVHKLLRKFKHISAKDELGGPVTLKTSPKRTLSSDNILDERRPISKSSPKHHVSVGDNLDGYSSLSKSKAVSMDNLLSKTKTGSFDSTGHISASSEENLLDENIVTVVNVINTKNHREPQSTLEVIQGNGSKETLVEEKMPRSNIVSAARSVFESISGPKPAPYKKRQTLDTVGSRTLSSGSSSYSGSVSSPIITPASPILTNSVKEKNLSNLNHNNADRLWNSSSQLQTNASEHTSVESGKSISNDVDHSPTSTVIYDVKPDNVQLQDDINANQSDKPDLRTGSSGITLTSYTQMSDTPDYTSSSHSNKMHYKGRNSSSGTVNASVPSSQVRSDPDRREKLTNHIKPKSTSPGVVTQVSLEEPTISEEITLHNQSAKDKTLDSSANIDNVQKEDAPLDSKSSDSVGSDEALHTKHAEGNRHNLNLNLNELNRKKAGSETSNVDINRNSKPASKHSEAPAPIESTKPKAPAPIAPIRQKASIPRRKISNRPTPEGPGSLLIRPASNLVAANTKTEYLILNQYHDIKAGEFAPAKKRPSYYDDSDEEVPITNIDDYLEDMPRTNIDEVSASGMPREGDPSKHPARRNVKKFEFSGAGVIVNRSLLKKTRMSKSKLQFEETISSTFEYPSEQFLLDTMPAEPGDFDYRDPSAPKGAPQQNGSVSDDEPPDFVEPSSLKSTPGVGSAGSLGSYQSKMQVDYFFGMEKEEPALPPKLPVKEDDPDNMDIKPAEEEDFTWSDATTSDMLF